MFGSWPRNAVWNWTRGVCLVAAIASSAAQADESREQAIKKDRELIKGTWRVVAVEENGEKTEIPKEGEVTKVVNDAEGGWEMFEGGRSIAKGTSTLDPSKTPKSIDIVVTEGDAKGAKFSGIYELGDNARRLCFDPFGKTRPSAFAATKGCGFLTFFFERVKEK